MAKWTREHEETRKRIIEMLQRDERPFRDLSDEAKAARRSQPLLDWGRTYLPHYFSCQFADFHRRHVAAMNAPEMPTFFGEFRGAGKSVINSLADPIKRTLEQDRHYWIYGSQVQALAVDLLDFVRIEFEHNPRIRADYGAPRVEGSEEDYTVELPGWRDSVRFEGFGIGMSPRGRRHGPHRPDAFVGDDLEDAQLARNPKRELNLWNWMMDEVVNGLEPAVWTFTVSGTMFGPGCMLERAREASEQRDSSGRPLGRIFIQAAIDETGHSVWPERFSDDVLDRRRAMIGIRNWNRNFALTADDPSKPFQPQWILQDFDPQVIDYKRLDVIVALDPAISEAATGCPRALVVIGADRETGHRHVLDAWIDRGSPSVMVEKLFDFNERFRPRREVIEENGGYALIREILRLEEQRRGVHLPVSYKSQTRAKELRIEGLAPWFERGFWHFPTQQSSGVKTLVDQFTRYPDGFVDGPDACAMADEYLPKGAAGAGEFHYERLQSMRSTRGI